jgi:azurin
MKYSILLPVFLAQFFSACSDPGHDHSAHDSAGHDHGSVAVSAAPLEPVTVVDGVTVIQMTGNDRMKFNIESFTVSAGGSVKLIFKNVGKMPKAAMGHNVVILLADADPDAFVAASASARENDYIPPGFDDQILVATKILGPGESDTIEFTAPSEAGEYVYLCSFPAHMFAGMRGVMVVE